MHAPADAERSKLRRIRDTAALARAAYTTFFNTTTRRTEVFYADDRGADARPIAILQADCDYDDRELLVHSAEWIAFLLSLVDRAASRVRALEAELRRLRGEPEPATKQKSVAKWCSITCSKPAFKRWLHDVHQVDTSDQERINARVRSMLSIQSRAELDTDPEAARRWKDMWSRFKTWEQSA